jgi:hypothetical protein
MVVERRPTVIGIHCPQRCYQGVVLDSPAAHTASDADELVVSSAAWNHRTATIVMLNAQPPPPPNDSLEK